MTPPRPASSRHAKSARAAIEGIVAALTVIACRGAPSSAPPVVVARVAPADAGTPWSPPTEPAVAIEPPPKPRDCCRGKNECKGLTGCRGDDHDCRGKNECKGLGTACQPDEDGAVIQEEEE